MAVEIGILALSTALSAEKSFALRQGLGKLRLIEVKELWLQEAVCRRRFKLHKIEGAKDPREYLYEVFVERRDRTTHEDDVH